MNSNRTPNRNLVDLCEHTANLKTRQMLAKQMADEALKDTSVQALRDADQLWEKIVGQLPDKKPDSPSPRAALPIAFLACLAAAVLAFLVLQEKPDSKNPPHALESLDLEALTVTASKASIPSHPMDEIVLENRSHREAAPCNRTRQSC